MARAPRSTGPLALAAGLVLFALGGLAGAWLAPASSGAEVRAATAGSGAQESLREAVAALSREVESLRGDLAMARGSSRAPDLEPLAGDLDDLRSDLLALRDADRRVAVGAGGDVVSGSLERRLDALEALVRERLVLIGGSGATSLRVPLGEPDRNALRQLFEQVQKADGNSDSVTARHRLWSYQAILDRYGLPDEVHVRDTHIEFEYALPEIGDNFDFHFVDGFCVLGH